MIRKPISKDFKIELLEILKQNYVTWRERDYIETYFRTYFDGYKPPKLDPLSCEELAELIISYEEENIGTMSDIIKFYNRLKDGQPPTYLSGGNR